MFGKYVLLEPFTFGQDWRLSCAFIFVRRRFLFMKVT